MNAAALADLSAETLTWDSALEAFWLRCSSQNISPRTMGLYRSQLRIFREWASSSGVNVRRTTPTHIRAFLDARKRLASSLTIDGYFRVLRTFWRFLERDGLIADNPMRRVERPRREKRMVRPFTADEIKQVLALLDPSEPLDIRDRALILFLADTGLRRGEALAVRVPEIDWERRAVRVFGKGQKERRVFFGEATARALRGWLEARAPRAKSDWLWIGRRGDQLSGWAFHMRLKERTRQAGIDRHRLSPHALRHFFALNFLRNRGDIIALQRILGHEDLTMVRNYANMSDEDAQEQHGRAAPVDRMFA